jgi:putative sterol carrier protein
MSSNALQAHLQQNFQPAVAARVDAVFRLEAGGATLSFRVDHGRLCFDLPPGTRPDATFMFRDEQTAWALLTGQGDAFEAFMDGRFRSDGYLMWAFALMAMFRSASLPATPTE